MVGLYVMISIALLLGAVNLIILIGLSLFLMRFVASLEENRDNVATAVEDITDMIKLMRGNFEDLKNFIRSLV